MVHTEQLAGERYLSKPDHRDSSPAKSQWTVAVSVEYEIFETTINNSWRSSDAGWGLNLVNEVAQPVGLSARDQGDPCLLHVAFFQLASVCHGYPSDPRRSVREIPIEAVRKDWLERKLVRPAAIRKMGRGIVCSP